MKSASQTSVPVHVIGFRLERERATKYLLLEILYDRAVGQAAAALAGFDPSPCKNPKSHRNV